LSGVLVKQQMKTNTKRHSEDEQVVAPEDLLQIERTGTDFMSIKKVIGEIELI